MNAEAPTHAVDWYVDHLLADTERFAAAIGRGPTDAEVAACPGWSVTQLAEHLGQVHRWAGFCLEAGRPPTRDDAPTPVLGDDDPATWLRDGAERLAELLRGIDPEAETWHPFPVAQIAGVWPRRQAHETAVHRWDAEQAVGSPSPIDAELASDGIDEYVELAIPRLIARESMTLPAGSLHLHCTDVDGEWLVWNEDGDYRMIRAHQKGDAALRGPAAEILLRLWGRNSAGADELSPIGDEEVLAGWLSIPGM